MDWERTINIFIVAFVILNLFFVFKLWLLPAFFDPSIYLSQDQIDATIEDLKNSNITVTAPVPDRLKRLQLLSVNTVIPSEELVAAALLGEGYERVASGAKTEYRSAQGKVDIYVDGRIYYISAAQALNGDITMDAARRYADHFLANTLGKPRDARAGRTAARQDGTWAVEYIQRWHRKDLEISRLVVIVDKSGHVLEMEYYWVEIIGFSGESILSIPATAALTVAAKGMPPGTAISRIYNSWYGMPALANQWQSVPVWVLETAAGGRYFINAHTGELEGADYFPEGKRTPALN